jgi:DNA repair and recombination protein RAD54B
MKQKVHDFIRNSNKVLIMSYEGALIYSEILSKNIDLLICDEGHRLKNTKIKIFRTLNSFRTKKRILVTGTPLQNNLEELFACVTFVNPLIFPSEFKFKKIYVGRN